jgi:hypothetical protein
MNDDDLFRALPAADVSPARSEQIRRRAHAILRFEKRAPAGSGARRHHAVIEPLLLLGLGLWQVAWAARFTWTLLR